MDAEITATRDTIVQGSFKTIAVDGSRNTEDILAALKSNRIRLQGLKAEYTKQIKSDGGYQKLSGKRQMIFQEIMRTYGALEGIKDELTRRGAPFDIDVFDYEHPNAAYKRMTAVKPKPGIKFPHVVLSCYLILCMIAFLFFVHDRLLTFCDFSSQIPLKPLHDALCASVPHPPVLKHPFVKL
jgi:hypothetical protein